jgi:hypothetical protein
MTLLALLLAVTASVTAEPLAGFLRESGKPPLAYLLARLDDHRIVIAGEGHRNRDDPALIASAVPELRGRRAVLAMEMLRTGSQEDIDRLLGAKEWDLALANRILHAADWPYVQYREILHEAWKANRVAGELPPLRILALGPPADFREKKIRYDEMAKQVIDLLGREPGTRVLLYCGTA